MAESRNNSSSTYLKSASRIETPQQSEPAVYQLTDNFVSLGNVLSSPKARQTAARPPNPDDFAELQKLNPFDVDGKIAKRYQNIYGSMIVNADAETLEELFKVAPEPIFSYHSVLMHAAFKLVDALFNLIPLSILTVNWSIGNAIDGENKKVIFNSESGPLTLIGILNIKTNLLAFADHPYHELFKSLGIEFSQIMKIDELNKNVSSGEYYFAIKIDEASAKRMFVKLSLAPVLDQNFLVDGQLPGLATPARVRVKKVPSLRKLYRKLSWSKLNVPSPNNAHSNNNVDESDKNKIPVKGIAFVMSQEELLFAFEDSFKNEFLNIQTSLQKAFTAGAIKTSDDSGSFFSLLETFILQAVRIKLITISENAKQVVTDIHPDHMSFTLFQFKTTQQLIEARVQYSLKQFKQELFKVIDEINPANSSSDNFALIKKYAIVIKSLNLYRSLEKLGAPIQQIVEKDYAPPSPVPDPIARHTHRM